MHTVLGQEAHDTPCLLTVTPGADLCGREEHLLSGTVAQDLGGGQGELHVNLPLASLPP